MTHLAVDRQVSAPTQNQAKEALLHLYKQVLQIEQPWRDEVVQAKTPRHLPEVLTPSEVRELLQHMEGTPGLICHLLYGTGMRVLEGLHLCVKDIGCERREIVVPEGQGNKDRVTVLTEKLITPLKAPLQKSGRGILSPLDALLISDLKDAQYPLRPSAYLDSHLI